MNWENKSQTWRTVSLTEVPPALLHALELHSAGARLSKIRLRWCPAGTAARKGFVTKDRLVDIEDQSCEELAIEVTSYAKHLYETQRCSNRFEAQFQCVQGDEEQTRQWRSLTFYLLDAEEQDDDLDSSDEEIGDDFFGAPRPPAPPIPDRVRLAPPATSRPDRSPTPAPSFEDYSDFVDMSRSDPTAFAMMVMQQTHDQTVSLMRDLLYTSTHRVDSILATQVSGSRYLNEALNTITRGAGNIAGLGGSLFESGLESRARVAEEERETVLGRERNELARDAIKQGSLLMQTILMANAARRSQEEQQQAAGPQQATTPARPARWPSSTASPPLDPTRAKTPLELDIEAKTQRFLDLLEHEPLDELRVAAPTLSALFDRLGEGPLDGARVLALIEDAEHSVEREELTRVHTLVSAELAGAFASLMMRAMSEQA